LPHRVQNFAPGAPRVPQLPQNGALAAGCDAAAPQPEQNLAPAASALPHCAQRAFAAGAVGAGFAAVASAGRSSGNGGGGGGQLGAAGGGGTACLMLHFGQWTDFPTISGLALSLWPHLGPVQDHRMRMSPSCSFCGACAGSILIPPVAATHEFPSGFPQLSQNFTLA
jgi:hypothetical protein